MTARLVRGRLLRIYRALLREHGHQHWWPGDTPFEVVVGAVLTQNTAWKNVEKALANLRAADVLAPRPLLATSMSRLRRLLVPAGYFRVKERRLRAVVEHVVERHGGDPAQMRRVPLRRLRAELLAVHGVGPETADSILLYAAGLPTFVVDAYTRRVFRRLGLVPADWSYEEVRAFFERHLPRSVPLYEDFHAQIVRLGNTRCRPTPACVGCPLAFACTVPAGAREGAGRRAGRAPRESRPGFERQSRVQPTRSPQRKDRASRARARAGARARSSVCEERLRRSSSRG